MGTSADDTFVNVHEAKTHLSRLLEQVAQGHRVTIARAGKPVADLVPHEPRQIVFGTLDLDYTAAAFTEAADHQVATLLGVE